MRSLVEPERIRIGQGLWFAARPSRRNPSGGLVAAAGDPAFRRTRVISRQSRQRLALGDPA